MAIEIIFSEISFDSTPQTADLMKLISPERQQQLSKFRFDIDRKLSLYAELLVRSQVRERLGIANQDITLSKNKYGKPYLQNDLQFQFNISHTHNAIAVAFSDDEIGIDIEYVRSSDIKISERFFSPVEQSYIIKSENQDQAFYKVWTRKEAYIKNLGKGLSIPLKSFNVLDNTTGMIINTFTIGKYYISICFKDRANKKVSFKNIPEYQMQNAFNF